LTISGADPRKLQTTARRADQAAQGPEGVDSGVGDTVSRSARAPRTDPRCSRTSPPLFGAGQDLGAGAVFDNLDELGAHVAADEFSDPGLAVQGQRGQRRPGHPQDQAHFGRWLLDGSATFRAGIALLAEISLNLQEFVASRSFRIVLFGGFTNLNSDRLPATAPDAESS
jgi:hypothetical protein